MARVDQRVRQTGNYRADVLDIDELELLQRREQLADPVLVGEVDRELVDDAIAAAFEDVDPGDVASDAPDARRDRAERTGAVGEPDAENEDGHHHRLRSACERPISAVRHPNVGVTRGSRATASALDREAEAALALSLMPTLVIVRHGESHWNSENRFTGWVDIDLSERGEKEATRAGELIAAEADIDIRRCFTSVLTRAVRTANLCLEAMERSATSSVERSSAASTSCHYGGAAGAEQG